MGYRTATATSGWSRTRSGSSYWLLYLLALTAAVCLPLAIRASGWVPEANRLVWTAFWGLAAGFVIAQVRAPDWMTWLGSMVLAPRKIPCAATCVVHRASTRPRLPAATHFR